jgi:hypothetical protein
MSTCPHGVTNFGLPDEPNIGCCPKCAAIYFKERGFLEEYVASLPQSIRSFGSMVEKVV